MAKKQVSQPQRTFESLASVSMMPEGYYSGDQPNPSLRRFVEDHATPFDPKVDAYKVCAFSQAITTTKASAIYNMHSYHLGKKPHDAIRQYIRHYTSLGDLVLDPFSGSGGTAIAALIEGRKAVAIDRSPAATFVTRNYCAAVDPGEFAKACDAIVKKAQPELDWLYETRCDRCGGKARTKYTVYSQVFQCPRCMKKVPLFECIDAEGTTAKGKPKKIKVCPHCHTRGHQEIIRSQSEKFGSVPVLVGYECLAGCDSGRGERSSNDSAKKKRQFFEQYDLTKVEEIEQSDIPHWFPKVEFPKNFARWHSDLRLAGINDVSQMYTKRNLWALSAIRAAAEKSAFRNEALFALTAVSLALSRMQRYSPDSGFPNMLLVGTYYVPQIGKEIEVGEWYRGKLSALVKGYRAIADQMESDRPVVISTADSRSLDIPSNSIDFIFTDPPYSNTVQYGELNFVWEAWCGFDPGWHDEEIIVNDSRGKTEADWAAMMTRAMAECYRVLKPGRWLSLCYHDTSEGTWGLVQDIMAEVGFVVDKTESTLFIDTGQKSFNQLTADKATKRDLVLNFRKPKPTDLRISQFIPDSVGSPTFQEAAQQVIREFLTAHPGTTKDRIYDTVVSCMIRKGRMEAHDFDTLLRSVAEEVQHTVGKNVGGKKSPESHPQGHWYLTETADQVDKAEQAREDAAATRLEKFMLKHLKEHPEDEGVHYSDLFEQYLLVQDKARRFLADWLPEYFIKTPSGTWRPPANDERLVLVALREAGTLRRIKRFANAIIDGVPVRDKDRPGSDIDLLDWLRQCRRAGLYEQGRAIYEKGGLNSVNLNDEQQIEAEDDYRICVRRGSDEEAKPKRKSRKTKEDDE